jgi:hypothetical protein
MAPKTKRTEQPMLNDILSAPVRTLAFLTSVALFALAAVGNVQVGDVQFGIHETLVRIIVAIVALGLLAGVLLLERPSAPSAPSGEIAGKAAGAPNVDTSRLPSGLYRWEQYQILEFATLLERADRLTISARTAVNILSRNAVEIRQFLQRGGRMRVLILDPAKAGLLNVYAEPSSQLSDNLRTGMRYLMDFGRAFGEQVQIRLTDRPPTYGLVWVDSLEKGKAIVEDVSSLLQVKIYLEYSRTGGGRPNLLICPSDDPWHRLFMDDFDNGWSRAHPVNMADESRGENV